jgi:1-phosphofructokinase family hexose kinase
VALLALGTTPTVQRTLTFDRLRVGGVNRAASCHDFASGKAVNVARVLAALGEPTTVLGLAGGVRGELLRRDLGDAGIPHELVAVESSTRLCVTVVSEGDRSATELVEEPGEVSFDDGRRLLTLLGERLGGVSHLIVSGSLAPGLTETYHEQCVATAHEAGAACVIDGRGPPLLAALREGPMVARMNAEELATTVGRPTSSQSALREAMREIVAAGAAWCVVTRGLGGASATNGDEFWDVPTPRVETVSAVGSGDAFTAGLTLAMSRGDSVPTACRYAAACGAANAMVAHAGHINAAAVTRLFGG